MFDNSQQHNNRTFDIRATTKKSSLARYNGKHRFRVLIQSSQGSEEIDPQVIAERIERGRAIQLSFSAISVYCVHQTIDTNLYDADLVSHLEDDI